MCSNPWTLDVSSLALQRSWFGSEVYSRTMGTNMKALFEEYGLAWEKFLCFRLISYLVMSNKYRVFRASMLRRFGTSGIYMNSIGTVVSSFNIRPETDVFPGICKARLGGIQQKVHIIVMHHLVIRF